MTALSGLSQIHFNVFESIYELFKYFAIVSWYKPLLSLADLQSLF